jgi:hypothetical protein
MEPPLSTSFQPRVTSYTYLRKTKTQTVNCKVHRLPCTDDNNSDAKQLTTPAIPNGSLLYEPYPNSVQ